MIESNHRKSKSVALKILHMDGVKKFDVGDLPFEVLSMLYGANSRTACYNSVFF